jgi:hypothetical protein
MPTNPTAALCQTSMNDYRVSWQIVQHHPLARFSVFGLDPVLILSIDVFWVLATWLTVAGTVVLWIGGNFMIVPDCTCACQ